MSNDLISRKEVLAIISPRLDSSKIGSLEHQRINSVFEEVKNLPTAYDVDKTRCLLEERKKYLEDEYAFAEARTRIDEIDTILKIVRSGGSGEVKGGVAK